MNPESTLALSSGGREPRKLARDLNALLTGSCGYTELSSGCDSSRNHLDFQHRPASDGDASIDLEPGLCTPEDNQLSK